jgi:hypothetical protein
VFWEARFLIYEFPDLDVPKTWVCVDTLRVDALTIDGPKDGRVMKLEFWMGAEDEFAGSHRHLGSQGFN